jgi:hypothetical protein
MSKKQIGIDKYRLSDISRISKEIKKAYQAYRVSLESQGVQFGLDVEAVLEETSNAVQINSSIKVPQAKRLELLGVNAQRPREAFNYLLQVMNELKLSFNDLDEDGNLSKECRERLEGEAVIYANGKAEVEYAQIIEGFVSAYEKLEAHHVNNNLNPFRSGVVAQSINGLVQPKTDGTGLEIAPNVFRMYCK